MPFLVLIARNVITRKVRSLLTGTAVAIGIMTVVALGVLTHSLRMTATSILRTGSADFTIAQKGVSDVLFSAMDETQVKQIQSYPEVDTAIGVLVGSFKMDTNHPFFLEIGIQPEDLQPFGVQVVAGRAYSADATDEAMLGYRAARDLGKTVGDTVTLDSVDYVVVGIFSTGQVFGDSASMLPLPKLQAEERKPGDVTLMFVKVKPGANIDALRTQIEKDSPELATVQTVSEFGRIDRNLSLISAANAAITIIALVIGAIGVMNTMMMSVFERTREFGVLRAVGWTRIRVLALVLGEAFLIALASAAVGVAMGYVTIRLIERLPEVVGFFQPDYTASVFGRALGIAVGMAVIGAIYPAVRAALLEPLEALRHE
jgi:putative ABC transport system permease protein